MKKWTVETLIAELECYPPNVEVVLEENDILRAVDEIYIDPDLVKIIIR